MLPGWPRGRRWPFRRLTEIGGIRPVSTPGIPLSSSLPCKTYGVGAFASVKPDSTAYGGDSTRHPANSTSASHSGGTSGEKRAESKATPLKNSGHLADIHTATSTSCMPLE
ncbi:hypothetical protein Bxe_B2684 [Paraburkholderia xenovorans LB400]|uniref:Uncharacterized protein n=1 Tax=Paraburkholderia xenovorans (strain LB400) TaxID=266265 RepID=Q13RI0_PARXL|nr:hypothetical protein Bxe_B2684 [Paraburkholderia xenovorans LB400]